MYYRDEDPNRTGSPDECFNSFMSDITGGRSDDIRDYEKRPLLPIPTQEDLDYEKAQAAEHKKQVDYFVKAQIAQYPTSAEQRDKMYAMHGFEVES